MITITVDGVNYDVPSAASDTNWAADQIAFEQALATGINEALATPTFTALTLINSWVSIGAVTPGYWRDASGRVWFRGAIGGGASGTAPWNPLPVGYRPPDTIILSFLADAGMGALQMTSAGIVTIANVTAGASVTTSSLLESLNFSTAA